jgi:4-alpha-glucanotransferase
LESLLSLSENFKELEELGNAALTCREQDRPNGIFLHSIPLAPSFVLKNKGVLERDLFEIAENFWTPVGLRTLKPTSFGFRAHCIGDQTQRDRAYHQGPAWGWLGGHFEMAKHRMDEGRFDKMFTTGILKDMPIEGHIAEIFDAEPPFTPRGAPAQAWSLACVEESKARRRLKIDPKITKVLAQRWMGRKQRPAKGTHPRREAGILG